MKRHTLLSLVAGVGMLGAMGPSRAHHAFSAEFDAEKPLKITGTVTNVEWQNPHTWFYIDVEAEDGTIANWGMELASPNLLMRNGWTRTSMRIGDVVTVEGFQAKNGSNIGNARAVTLTATGKQLFAGPSDSRSKQ